MTLVEFGKQKLENNTDPTWYRDKSIRRCIRCCVVCFIAQMTAGYDESTTGSFQAMNSWERDLGYPDSSQIGLITSMLYAGGIVGSFVGGPVADRFGRRAILILGAAVCILGTALQSSAVNISMFIVGRTLLGFGVTNTLIGGPSLVTELAHPRIRGTILSFYNVLWYLGAIIASWLTFGTSYLSSTWAWRIPSISQATPSLALILLIWTVPESPRWLTAHGRREEAHRVLAHYHANGDMDDPLVLEELRQFDQSENRDASSSTWWDLYRESRIRSRIYIVIFIAICVDWCGQNNITYYFSPILEDVGVTDATVKTGINGGMQVWNFIIAIIGACLVDRLGRRPLWLASFIGMVLSGVSLISTTSTYTIKGSIPAGYATIATLFIYNASFNIGCNPLPYSYTAEILPYRYRAKGLAVFNFASWAFTLGSLYASPVALARLGWRYYCVFLGFNISFVVVIFFFFPETKIKTEGQIDAFFSNILRKGGREYDDAVNDDGLDVMAAKSEVVMIEEV